MTTRGNCKTAAHDREYLDFEGIIPRGQYGGGTGMLWDIGTYDLVEGNYYKGFLRVYLNGLSILFGLACLRVSTN